MKPLAIGLCLAVATLGAAQAQSMKTPNVLRLDASDNQPEANLEQLHWLVGSWSGEGLGGQVEETWSAPSGGTMLGSFKLIHNGVPSIYEIELLEEVAGSLVWKVKHFNTDFTAWEEKAEYVSFPLVKIEKTAAYFDGLTVRQDGDDGLQIFVTMSQDGELSEEEFKLKRIR